MTPQEFFLLLISVMFSTLGQLFLKLGALKLGKVTSSNFINHVLSIIITPELLIGLMCYGIGAISYILVLTRVKLSVASPSASLIYIFSVLLGYFVFHETITITRFFGLTLIIWGVILVVWKNSN